MKIQTVKDCEDLYKGWETWVCHTGLHEHELDSEEKGWGRRRGFDEAGGRTDSNTARLARLGATS